MATVGDVPPLQTTGYHSDVWWSHPHQHAQHVHALAYCAPCDAAYCMACNRQWGGHAAFTWTNAVGSTTATSAGLPSDATITHGGH